MSARDMARFGLLYLRKGAWKDQTILQPAWIDASTKDHTGSDREGYGYLWWVMHRVDGFAARGGRSQLILVIPRRQLVFVTQIPPHVAHRPRWSDVGRLLSLVFAAKTGEA